VTVVGVFVRFDAPSHTLVEAFYSGGIGSISFLSDWRSTVIPAILRVPVFPYWVIYVLCNCLA
jgi:hypothetical protein